MIAANIVNILQTVVSRKANPLSPIVLTIGIIEGGYARNIIANKVRMSGIIRMMEEEKRDEIVEMVEKICDNTAKAMGGEVEFKRTIGYPCLVNHKGMTDLIKETAFPLLGEGNVIEVAPTMGVEDFAYFLQKVPGSFYKLGCGNKEKGIDKPIHNNQFNIDEECIKIGLAVHVSTVLKYLNSNG